MKMNRSSWIWGPHLRWKPLWKLWSLDKRKTVSFSNPLGLCWTLWPLSSSTLGLDTKLTRLRPLQRTRRLILLGMVLHSPIWDPLRLLQNPSHSFQREIILSRLPVWDVFPSRILHFGDAAELEHGASSTSWRNDIPTRSTVISTTNWSVWQAEL